MNERMIELYTQAQKFAYKNISEEYWNTDNFHAIVSGKFAELIVKECSDALEKRHQEFKGTKSEYANGFKSGISAAKRTLDAHFKDNT
jgi:hypothetical protein